MKMRFFQMAKKLAPNSDHSQHKMACVIARKNKLVSAAVNMNRTHPKSTTRFNTLHAEVAALLGMSYENLKGCEAYIYRETKSGDLGMAKPCDACHQALKLAGIETIYYSSPSGFQEERIA